MSAAERMRAEYRAGALSGVLSGTSGAPMTVGEARYRAARERAPIGEQARGRRAYWIGYARGLRAVLELERG